MDAERYEPCRNGIHVCGSTPDLERPQTVANVPGVGSVLFDVLADQFGVDGDFDLVVDFMKDGDIIKDFGIRRQSLDALLKLCSQ